MCSNILKTLLANTFIGREKCFFDFILYFRLHGSAHVIELSLIIGSSVPKDQKDTDRKLIHTFIQSLSKH